MALEEAALRAEQIPNWVLKDLTTISCDHGGTFSIAFLHDGCTYCMEDLLLHITANRMME